jgi:hypothetical protein
MVGLVIPPVLGAEDDAYVGNGPTPYQIMVINQDQENENI